MRLDGASSVTTTAMLAALMDRRDESAWRHLVNRYQPLLVRYSAKVGMCSSDRDDFVQATLAAFATAFGAGQYQRERGRLRDWLFGIARNQAHTFRRAARRSLEYAHAGADPDEIAEKETFADEWERAILEESLRVVQSEVDGATFEAFDLFALRGLTARIVADRLGISENAVYLAKRRVLSRLRQLKPTVEQSWQS